MKKELLEIKEISEKVQNKLDDIKKVSKDNEVDTNEIKIVKNNIYEKTSKIFVHNLKKLIQLEGTQKNLAKKIGISEDLLSKYKSSEAFPSIETLLYLCEVYNISLTKFINSPLSAEDIEHIENNEELVYGIFEEKYYVYFYVTNLVREGAIHEGIIEICENNVVFKILSGEKILKSFSGNYKISDKLVFFTLKNVSEGNTYINMIKPNINKNKYVGGVAMLLLSSDANSKPCSQKILFSKVRIDREMYYNDLKEILNFNIEDKCFGNIKISLNDDEIAYQFIERMLGYN